MKSLTAVLAAAFVAASVVGFAAPGGQACCGGMQGMKAAKHTAPKAGEVRYKAQCGMTYSAAEAKKLHYVCPMDHKPLTKIEPAKPGASAKSAALVCPVTGEKIASVKAAAGSSAYKGKTYYFCCGMCKPKFDKNPAKYVANAAKGKFEKM